VIAPLALVAALALAPASDGRLVMGTVLDIEVTGGDRALLELLFARAAALDAMLTRFDPESPLSRLNAASGGGPVALPAELLELLEFSRDAARATHGAFDVTVGPLVDLWWRAAGRGTPPSAGELAAARARVGSERIELRDGRATLLSRGSSVDLGGIAKGYALDALVALLRARGAGSALLCFGGSSLHALGAPPDGDGWRVLLHDAGGDFAGVVTLRDRALSVSGSLGQSFEIAGRRYGHVIDPRSGRPLERARVAAVVADSGARAEALSKALLVLGEREGIDLIDALPDAEAVLLDADGRRFETKGWQSATEFEPTGPSGPPLQARNARAQRSGPPPSEGRSARPPARVHD
jgi:thiamine biosynthesis lipoprotein